MHPVDKITAVLNERGWVQECFESSDGVCLGEAIDLAFEMQSPADKAYLKINQIRKKLYPGRGYGILTFNDHPDTTRADIDVVLSYAKEHW